MGISEQGISSERYSVIPRVLIFPFSTEGKVLLLKGSETKRVWPGLWNGIGGHIKEGESILDAAKRELKEESGLRSRHWQFCGEVMVDTQANPGIAIFIFKVEELEGNLQESNEGKLSWFDPIEVSQLPAVEDLPTLIGKVGRFQPNSRPFWGLYRYDQSDQLVMSFED